VAEAVLTFRPCHRLLTSFKNPNLKFLLFRTVLQFSLKAGVTIVLTNSTLAEDIRRLVKRLATKFCYQQVMVYFNMAEKTLQKHRAHTKKSEQVFIRQLLGRTPIVDSASTLNCRLRNGVLSFLKCIMIMKKRPKSYAGNYKLFWSNRRPCVTLTLVTYASYIYANLYWWLSMRRRSLQRDYRSG